MTILGREAAEIEALVTDAYLDSLLAGRADRGHEGAPGARDVVDAAVRLASRRLTRDLPRFHPSFRFEERLAVRLAERAASLRLRAAAGAEGTVVPLDPDRDAAFDPFADPALEPAGLGRAGDPGLPRPLIIGGAVAASALSLAGAALVAWRRNRSGASPMARAARAAHARRPT